MITLRELQDILMNKEFNPYIDIGNSDKVLIHLVEEIGELAKAHRKANIFNTRKELADCQILLLFYAESMKIGLEHVTCLKILDNVKTGKFNPSNQKLLEIKRRFEK